MDYRTVRYKDESSGPLPTRFLEKISIDENGCWNWLAAKTSDGYGLFWGDGYMTTSHKFAYERLVKKVGDEMTIDHLCRNRLCANPSHVEEVTRGENVLRGFSPSSVNKRKTHCKRGHELSGENVYVRAKVKKRMCKVCRRLLDAIGQRISRVGKTS